LTIGCSITSESLVLGVTSKNNELITVSNFDYEVEIVIQKVRGEALHHKFFRQKINVKNLTFYLITYKR